MQVYHGTNIHAYTPQIKQTILDEFKNTKQEPLSEAQLAQLWTELTTRFPRHPAVANIQRVTKNGIIIDPQLPPLNFLQLLWELWDQVKKEEQFQHFRETLDQIGQTCIQGVTHRIFIDWRALQ